MDSDLMRWVKAQADDPNANPRFRELLAALEAAREDAERWRHARRILSVGDIESSQDILDAFGAEDDEHENRKADAAIDQARGKEVGGD